MCLMDQKEIQRFAKTCGEDKLLATSARILLKELVDRGYTPVLSMVDTLEYPDLRFKQEESI